MPSVKLRVKRETRVAEVREGRWKATEPSARGRAEHAVDAPQVCCFCDGQSRWGKLPSKDENWGNPVFLQIRRIEPTVDFTDSPMGSGCARTPARRIVSFWRSTLGGRGSSPA